MADGVFEKLSAEFPDVTQIRIIADVDNVAKEVAFAVVREPRATLRSGGRWGLGEIARIAWDGRTLDVKGNVSRLGSGGEIHVD